MKRAIFTSVDRINKRLPSHLKRVFSGLPGKLIAVLSVALIGSFFLVSTKAATPTATIEVGTNSQVSAPATVISDSTASGGSAVVFPQATSGGGTGGEQCEAGVPAPGGWTYPNLCGWPTETSTGPRYEPTVTSGSMTTSFDGQIIERIRINGSLDIRHNNVIVRDVYIQGTGIYALDIGQNTDPCPINVRVEYSTVDMANVDTNALSVYQRCPGGLVLDHFKVINAFRGIQLIGNATVTNSFVFAHRTNPGDHRTAISSHGGANFTVRHNTFMCVGENCSSSVNMYSDYAPISNYLFEDNLVGGGTICVRGGETHTYAAETSYIRILNNRFSTHFNPLCGIYQPLAQFDADNPGNVRSGNVYHESGDPIPGE